MSRKTKAIDATELATLPQFLPGVIPGREPTITLNRVSKWYGDIVAVSDVTFGVTPGVTALLGPNGAGKSTTLKMITGLLSMSTGKISILGKPGSRQTGHLSESRPGPRIRAHLPVPDRAGVRSHQRRIAATRQSGCGGRAGD